MGLSEALRVIALPLMPFSHHSFLIPTETLPKHNIASLQVKNAVSCLCYFPHTHMLKLIVLTLLYLILGKSYHNYGPNFNLIPITIRAVKVRS